MSILVVQLVAQGMLFAADRNITHQAVLGDGSTLVTVQGQTQRPKVLKWPNHELILGYVGAAEIESRPTDEWLYAFIGRNLTFSDLDSVARKLSTELDALFRAGDFDQPLILHFGGFENINGDWTPRIYFIRNTVSVTASGAYVLGSRFDWSEEIAAPAYFAHQTGSQIRAHVVRHYFSFRQGFDLAAFNVIDVKLREAMTAIMYAHPGRVHAVPTTLDEWANFIAFAVHGYGAYFAAFYPPFEQYVGGGADVVGAAWP